MALHSPFLWKRGLGQLGNGLLLVAAGTLTIFNVSRISISFWFALRTTESVKVYKHRHVRMYNRNDIRTDISS